MTSPVRMVAIIVAWMDQEQGRGEKDIEAVTDVLTGWDGLGVDADAPALRDGPTWSRSA